MTILFDNTIYCIYILYTQDNVIRYKMFKKNDRIIKIRKPTNSIKYRALPGYIYVHVVHTYIILNFGQNKHQI